MQELLGQELPLLLGLGVARLLQAPPPSLPACGSGIPVD